MPSHGLISRTSLHCRLNKEITPHSNISGGLESEIDYLEKLVSQGEGFQDIILSVLMLFQLSDVSSPHGKRAPESTGNKVCGRYRSRGK